MEDEKAKSTEEYTLLLCLDSGELEIVKLEDLPRNWPLGQYCSRRTGTKSEMENLRRILIHNNLKTLMKHG
ncbi:hypothetical protein LH29_00570 [Draconibacterium sediminis]|uniref:Uncharacterized protein n=1 Tax=Draconibacterium sediminis TaxID=1544798 RepID=A0A0D8JAX9_9BACT|nr:hypothetical protein LH29_00570 [Draconibacterium sediminis]